MIQNSTDDYIDAIQPNWRAQFDTIWNQVQEIAPYAEVGLSYGIPALKYKGKPLIAVAVFKDHIGIYPFGSTHTATLKKQLAGFAGSTGGFKVKAGQKVTISLLKKLIALRKAEIDGSLRK